MGVEGREQEERKEGKLWSVFKMRGKGVLVCSRTQADRERIERLCNLQLVTYTHFPWKRTRTIHLGQRPQLRDEKNPQSNDGTHGRV